MEKKCERKREGSKIGPRARQKASSCWRPQGDKQQHIGHSNGSLVLPFCLYRPTTSLSLKGRKGFIQGFGELTLCGCVTVMAVGYRAQGQGGSKEMYFYSCFQGTGLVQRRMSQERCKPPSNKSPSPRQENLSFPLTISTENVIVSQISSNFSDT